MYFFKTTEAVKKRFDEEEVSIPFPQRDVHVYQHTAWKGEKGLFLITWNKCSAFY